MRSDLKSKLAADGVVVLEGFLTEGEAEELRLAGLQLHEEWPKDQRCVFQAESPDKTSMDQYLIESNDKIRYFLEADSDGTENPSLNKVGHALHWLHPLFRFYTFSARVKQACLSLGLQDPAVVQSMFIYKSAGVGGGVKPHQDATYLSTEPETAIGFWIALEDATLQNGCLMVARGSHKSGVHRRLIRNPDKSSPELTIYDRSQPMYPESNFTPLPVCKGDCILIHGQVVHKSSPNRSDKGRPAYTFHVVEKSAQFSKDNWLQEGPGAPFVSLYEAKQTA